MITIGSFTRVPDPPEPDASLASDAVEQPPEPAKKSLPLMAIPITISVGLLVAAGYVGHRIVSAKSVHASPAAMQNAVVQQVAPLTPVVQETLPQSEKTKPTEAPAPAPAPQLPVVAKEEAAQPRTEPVETVAAADDALIDPQPGQRYLQIAAIGTQAVNWFMADLRRGDLQVRLAPGPREGLRRVLIGPFPDWESLNATKSKIQKMFPDCFVRAY